MISAANLLQQLSGNKLFLVLIPAVLLLMSCGSPRTVSGPSTPPPPLPFEEDKEVVIDTIQWNHVIDEEKPAFIYPEDSPYRERIADGLPSPEIKSSYNILLVLPMAEWSSQFKLEDVLEEIEELIQEDPDEDIRLSDYINEAMIGFLNGFEFSLKQHTDLPFKIIVEVVAGGDDQLNQLRRALAGIKFIPDVIIGGGSRAELEILSEFSSKNKSVLVSPWFTGQFSPNPQSTVVSFQPDITAHYDVVLERLQLMADEDEFHIIYSPREIARVDQFKELFFQKFPGRTFGEILFQEDTDILEFDFSEYFNTESKSWFFIPMTRNHPFIHPILRAIDLTKPSRDYEVIGLTLWDRDIHLEFHQKLNLVNTNAQLPVAGNKLYRKFHLEFYEKMGYIGGMNEYKGKVTADFISGKLLTYGHRFPYYLPFSEPQNGHFRWQFSSRSPDTPMSVFGNIPANLRNRGIYLLTFEEGKFKALNN